MTFESTSHLEQPATTNTPPLIFEEFFDLGQQETSSPFIKRQSRQWSSLLALKAAIAAAFLLIVSFALSWWPQQLPLAHFLLIIVYFLAGVPALIESVEDLIDFEINIDVLMTLAAFSSVMIGSGFEGALLLVLFALSGAMEEAVTSKARSALNSLHRLAPTTACVIQADGKLQERSVKDINIGTSILVKSGQIVPLDGEVTEGATTVNLVHLTGESLPVTKIVGDTIPAGARNLEGAVALKVTHTSADSTLAKIIILVTQAQDAKPKLQRWFDSLSRSYAIGIILFSFVFAVSMPYLWGLPFLGHEGSLYRALTFLIAASPCALIIAIPIAYLSAISACAAKGILLKGGIALDALSACSAIALDKTGTLTTGQLAFGGIKLLSGNGAKTIDEQKALSVAYALEKNAMHPIAKAVVSYCEENNVLAAAISAFKTVPGYGVVANVENDGISYEVRLGNTAFIEPLLNENQNQYLHADTAELVDGGAIIALMHVQNHLFLFYFFDELRPTVKEGLDKVRSNHKMRTLMLTGDHYASAKRIADAVNLDEFHADLKPEDKLAWVADISRQQGLAMVGDGINDAPALARATVGIAMGKVGSTTAVDAADIVLLHDNIELLPWLIDKARLTKNIVKQNLAIATIAMVGASLPALGGYLPLWLAVILHEGGTVLVGLNALRLLRK